MKKILFSIIGIFLIGSVLALTVEQQVTVTVLPGAIDIYSPVQDAIYTNRMVPINLSMSAEVIRFEYFEDSEGQGTLCRNCDEYGYNKLKRKPFDDGFIQMKIVAVFEQGEVYGYKNFTVDTTKPKIKKTLPARGFAIGEFSVEFQEANPTELWLNYGDDAVGFRNAQIDLSTCYEPKRNRIRCDVNVDLADYDLQEIKYWFNLTDILGQYTENKPKKIDVDISKPVINFFNYTINGKYVTFLLNVTEPNFDKINYIDYNSNIPKWKLLCSTLKDSICEKKKSFKTGEHNISIEILDEAGNREAINDLIFGI